MRPRIVGLIAALCLSGGWLLGSLLMPPTASLQSLPVDRTPSGRVAPPAQPYTERLRVRLDEAPQAPAPARNPFRFADPPPAGDAGPRPRQDIGGGESIHRPPVAVPSGPVFSLVGMATSDDMGQTVRTAIVSDGWTVHYVTVGGSLPGGSTVSRVEDTSVVITDTDGRTRTLSFR